MRLEDPPHPPVVVCHPVSSGSTGPAVQSQGVVLQRGQPQHKQLQPLNCGARAPWSPPLSGPPSALLDVALEVLAAALLLAALPPLGLRGPRRQRQPLPPVLLPAGLAGGEGNGASRVRLGTMEQSKTGARLPGAGPRSGESQAEGQGGRGAQSAVALGLHLWGPDCEQLATNSSCEQLSSDQRRAGRPPLSIPLPLPPLRQATRVETCRPEWPAARPSPSPAQTHLLLSPPLLFFLSRDLAPNSRPSRPAAQRAQRGQCPKNQRLPPSAAVPCSQLSTSCTCAAHRRTHAPAPPPWQHRHWALQHHQPRLLCSSTPTQSPSQAPTHPVTSHPSHLSHPPIHIPPTYHPPTPNQIATPPHPTRHDRHHPHRPPAPPSHPVTHPP